ncbi:MAG: alkaline phosphatase PhoX, partial [Pseudomonadota bacterium]
MTSAPLDGSMAVMTASDEDLSFDDFDEVGSVRPETTDFDRVVDAALDRRGFLSGLLAVGTTAFLTGHGAGATSALAQSAAAGQPAAASRFAFDNVPASTADTVTLPPGFSWKTVVKWGEPLWPDAADFDPATRGTADSQARAFGDNNDGMAVFSDGRTTVFAVNNEYTNRSIIYGNRESKRPETDDDIAKGKAAHGVSIFEVADAGVGWSVVKGSPLNRRITADTPMSLTGPAAGHDLL